PPEDGYFQWLVEKVPYYRTMTGRFAPMYEPLARQMVLDYKLDSGVAIEVGGSAGAFAMELARKTRMVVYNLDIDPWAIRLCAFLVDRAGLTGRVIPVEGDALNMPFKDNFADFIFSRGSIPFWADQAQGLRECYRVLKPGGVGYIGHGGFGRLLDPAIRAQLVRWRLTEFERRKPEGWHGPGDRLPELARQAGIPEGHFRLVKEPDVGWWLEMRK
ncbi:MAG: class I SAM-dependent methyltransferase, partial [Armatimonadetes bacterium]|nr:class I SAM-dependent methyltransferase [Armatimonadota bacterium]